MLPMYDPYLSHSIADASVATNGSRSGEPSHLSTTRWLIEGLRSGFFLVPRTAGRLPSPLQAAVLTAWVLACGIALARLQVFGSADFSTQAWLSGWWSYLIFIGAGWWALAGVNKSGAKKAGADDWGADGLQAGNRASRLSAFFVLSLGAAVPSLAASNLFGAALSQRWLPASAISSPSMYWAIYGVFMLWSFGSLALLLRRFVGWSARNALFVAVMLACTGVSIWQLDQRIWREDDSQQAMLDAAKPRLRLSQQTFEAQEALWLTKLAALAPQREGVADVYGLVFAPYASEDVFKREAELVSGVLAKRFDAEGRVLTLLNHATTTQTELWATPPNIERAIQALAARMDLQNDLLVVYATSHGGSDFKLAASHWPLEVDSLTAQQLRSALDKAGIRHRVIAVSACYSGGWVAPLASDTTLVMTAADATHTSYGCGRLSELTFFGRELFDEQLRVTHSFEQAFLTAVPLIKQREIDAGKSDGFSNPQISVGSGIKPYLTALQKRLGSLQGSGPTASLPPTRPPTTPAASPKPAAQ